METLVPPKNAMQSALLAGAGDLVIPLLEIKSNYKFYEVKGLVDTLVQIDTNRSHKMILSYFREAKLTDTVMELLLDAISYIDSGDFSEKAVGIIKQRHDYVPIFFSEYERVESNFE